MLSPQQLALHARLRQSQQANDPLLHHRWSSEKMRAAVCAYLEGQEVCVRAGLRAGKTTGFASTNVAIGRGLRELDSRTINEQKAGAPRDVIQLPAVKTPAIILLGVSSLKQASESTIGAYLLAIGNHDHRILKGPAGSIVDIRVRPDHMKSEDPDRWSRIMVFPIEGTPPSGIGATVCHADETPTQELWTQMRMRISAGQHLYRAITHTPEDIARWEWLAEDYKHPDPWKVEFVLSVFENQALSHAEKESQREKAGRDPLELARLYGAYVNLAGDNPFKKQMKLLERWLQACRDPIRVETLTMPVEIETETGLKVVEGFGEVFIWEEPIPGERYYVPGDGSLGLDGGDPCGAHIYSRGFKSERPREVVRYNGMCGSYALGLGIMAPLAERYNDGLCEPDCTGGYGQPTLRGLADYRSKRHTDGYPHINRDRRIDSVGNPYSTRLGFTVTAAVKADMIESLRQAILTDAIDFPSAATVRCFMEARLDKHGRLTKSGGLHYEDFHCAARVCQLLLDRTQMDPEKRRDDGIEDMVRREGINVPILRPQASKMTRYPWRRS